MNEKAKLFNKTIKKKVGEIYSFLNLVLGYAFLLPTLLIFGITLQTHLMEDIDWEFLYNAVTFPFIISALLLITFYMAITLSYKSYYKRQITKHGLKCVLCEKNAIIELYKIPYFFITFGIPLCEQHAKSLDENPEIFLYKEQKLYKKYNRIILWFNILIIAFGLINLIYFGYFYGFIGNIPLNILIYLLFAFELLFHFFLYIRMFLLVRAGISSLSFI
ncbi:MAG: hypothetical protein ACFFFB_05085 [Candidatus Heimdallarchaeota archaeon]